MKNIIDLWKLWIARVRAEYLKDEIRRLAYIKAVERNFEPGHEWEDWFEAEKEIVGRYYKKCCDNLTTS